MPLTPAQYVTLKTAINAETDSAFVALRTSNSTGAMAVWLEGASTFIVNRTTVTGSQLMAAIVLGTANEWLDPAVTQAHRDLILGYVMGGVVQLNDPNVRNTLGAVFPAGSTTRTNLIALSKRPANRFERIFATGTGTTGSPGTLVVEGTPTDADIVRALGS